MRNIVVFCLRNLLIFNVFNINNLMQLLPFEIETALPIVQCAGVACINIPDRGKDNQSHQLANLLIMSIINNLLDKSQHLQ